MEALGFDTKSFLLQLFDFVVVFTALRYFLHKPLMKLLDSRRAAAKAAVEQSEKLRVDLESLEKKQEEVLEAARKEAREILHQTKEQAGRLESQLKADAQKQAESLKEKARADLQAERDRLRQELQSELSGLVLQATEKVLRSSVGKDTKAQIEEAVNELKG